MRQDNLDNKIKDIFGSMDDHDRNEALKRKEDSTIRACHQRSIRWQ